MPNNNNLAEAVRSSLITHNTETGHAWTFGTNWTNEGKEFETYVNKYLFLNLMKHLSSSQFLETVSIGLPRKLILLDNILKNMLS